MQEDHEISPLEKELVEDLKIAKRKNLSPGSKWNLVGIKWMRKWMNYVNFDGYQSRYLDRSYPGPMQNEDLFQPNTTVLKRNLLEDLDYALVPHEVYKHFADIYEGGPEITRNAVPCSSSRQVYMIDVYPVIYNVYVASPDAAGKTSIPMKPTATIEQSKYTSFSDVKKHLFVAADMDAASISHRLWARKPEYFSQCKQEETAGLLTSKVEDSGPRYMTTKRTDVLPGQWVHLKDDYVYTHDYPSGTIDIMIESLGEDDSLDLPDLPEASLASPAKLAKAKQFREDILARKGLLSYWLNDLREGDVVDGKDQAGKWYEAIVVAMPPTTSGEEPPPEGSIRLRYKCWSPKWNDTLLPNVIAGRIWPLYSKTPNWRAQLRTGDGLEVLTTGIDEVANWEYAKVVSVDGHRSFVSIRYTLDGKADFKTLPIQSDKICAHPTHVKEVAKVSNTQTAYSTGSQSGVSSYMSTYSTTGSHWTSGGRAHETGGLQAGGEPGVVGLRNLGNTCFMNSMLQCLSHANDLTSVFLSDAYIKQINTDNVLGMGGKIANVYGSLLKCMWAQKYSVVNPYEFKDTIGQFQEQFAGFQQQDSQEFMLYLLDGLHEDLNRIQKKPSVEKIESKGRADDLISREAWRRFLLRNDSEIVDRLFGQLKSHVTCRNCGYESVTFDEFNSLALPVPVKNTRRVPLTLFPLPPGSTPLIVTLEVEVTCSVSGLKDALLMTLDHLTKKDILQTDSSDVENIASEPYLMVGSDAESPTEIHDFASNVPKLNEVVFPPSPPSSDRKAFSAKDYFHVVSYSTYSKKLTMSLSDTTPVQDLLKHRGAQQIYVFQLEHNASPKDYQEYDTAARTGLSSYSSYLSGAAADRAKPDEKGYRFVDIIMMKPPTRGAINAYYQSTHQYPSVLGCGGRISFEVGATSHKALYESVEKLVLSYLPANSPYAGYSRIGLTRSNTQDAPFKIYYSNQYGTSQGEEFPFDSDAVIGSILPRNQLFVLWNENALKREQLPRQNSANSNNNITRSAGVAENLFRRRYFSKNALLAPTIIHPDTVPEAECNEVAGDKKRIDITDCLNKFSEREIMPEEETWFCPSCKEHKSPIKKFDLWATPEILIVQLKRFQYIPGSYFIHREKISDLVEFPIDGLDLSPYIQGAQSDSSPPVYDLFAVSEHSGGLGGGHYTAVAKSPSGKWINYNDSFCSAASMNDIVTPSAYILFYKRRGDNLRWAGIKPLAEGVITEDTKKN